MAQVRSTQRDVVTWLIVDYKTERRQRCGGREQVAAYQRAWGRFVKEPVSPTIVSARAERSGS